MAQEETMLRLAMINV